MECSLSFVYECLKDQDEYVSFHKHECYELVYYVKGFGSSTIAGGNFNYSPSGFTIIEPDCLHDERHNDNTRVLFIGFKYKGRELALKNGLYMDDHQQTVFNLLVRIKKEITLQKKHFALKADTLLKELLIELSRLDSSLPCKSSDFSYIKRFIEENCNQSIDLKELASLTGYSYHHFRHLFKQKTGMSPVQYIIVCRLSKARQLLVQTDLPIMEISHDCGFYDESQFSAMFRKDTGTTPSLYRRNGH